MIQTSQSSFNVTETQTTQQNSSDPEEFALTDCIYFRGSKKDFLTVNYIN